MSKESTNIHIVCTIDEAENLINKHKSFYVSNCGCREGNDDGCSQSREDVCLMFNDIETSGSGKRVIKKSDALEILKEAKEKLLVPRPFRDNTGKIIDGICFCCKDCCYYFTEGNEECDKGLLIESTDIENCNHCLVCIDVCYFEARKEKKDKLVIDSDSCYGCGLCVASCPEECITMVPRL